ncbi:class I SAM-dependent methyltransferase [Mycobacterium sp. 1164966.3]|uniref:class I SAM-dependent methyltransferase n=1 Tax=Mycobacterium sp. 1164966.3 TaxID=1856861 RepID=UPI001C12BC31
MPTESAIDDMPRGGPDASWLDRELQTDRLEYLDRDDAAGKKRAVVRSLDRMGRVFGLHERFARVAFDEIRDVPDAKVLELGSAHGGLSRRLLELHPSAHITVTDVEPGSVAAIAAGELGDHPCVTARHADPAIHVELRGGGLLNSPIHPRPQIVVATRRLRRGR